MKSLVLYCFALVCLLSGSVLATTHTVVNSGFSFSPSSLTINVGDTVVFNLGSAHNVVEVSQATWNANGNTPLSGGFTLPFGGGTLIFSTAGTEYYVCSPHASSGMKGTINVVQTTVSTSTLAASSYCVGDMMTVPYTASGNFQAGNTFTAQLSDGSGSFSSPTTLGSVASTTSGQISGSIPGSVVTGTGYRVRVVSSMPVLVANDNGSDLSISEVPNASITPAGPTTFCEGSSVTLDASPTGAGLTYIWRRDGIVIVAASGASYIAALAGQYTVEVSNGTCSSTSSPRPVFVNPADPTTLTWTAAVDTDWGTVGNWDNPCAVPTAGDTVIINGGVQPPAGTPALSIDRLVLNNSAGLTLNNDLEITGVLVMSSGSITLGINNLTISSAAMISGATSSNFIITDGSGELRQEGLGSGGRSAAVLFPVGINGFSYTPVSVTNAGTQDVFAVRVAEDVLTDGSSGSALLTDIVDRTWFISEGIAGGSNADLTFMWNGADELPAFDRTACFAAHHDGSDWSPVQSIGAASGGPVYQRTATGVSSFSPFAIGDASSPLPVELSRFSADVDGRMVHLRWETTQETDCAGFAVQRADERQADWEDIIFLPSRSPRLGTQYFYTDETPGSGTWSYRLRQVDLDGSESYSPVLRVQVITAASLALENLYPNPVFLSNGASVSLQLRSAQNAPVRLTLHNVLGEEVMQLFEGNLAAGESRQLQATLSSLVPGVYIYRLSQGDVLRQYRMLVQH
ncbi:T9SS type A sorting domain-containing protein [bacterium]|nr:T9SS type A sorting domain-containing protein [bacterium]